MYSFSPDLTLLTVSMGLTTSDLMSGYRQVELLTHDAETPAAATTDGLFLLRRFTFGMCDATALF